MTRVSYVEKDKGSPAVAEIFQKMESHGAQVINLWKVAAHVPSTLLHFIRMGNALLSKTRLDPALRELAVLRVAALLKCAYEKRAHDILGKAAGMSEAKLNAVADGSKNKVFSDVERAVLCFTDEVVQQGRVKEETFTRLAGYLDEGMLVELVETIGFYGMIARILLAFEVDLDEEEPTPSGITGRRKD